MAYAAMTAQVIALPVVRIERPECRVTVRSDLTNVIFMSIASRTIVRTPRSAAHSLLANLEKSS